MGMDFLRQGIALTANLSESTVCNEFQILFHHLRIHAKHTPWHRVACVLNFKRQTFQDHLRHLRLKLLRP